MTTHTLNRRDLLGTTATGLAALVALSGTGAFNPVIAGPLASSQCIADHRQLAKNLGALTQDPSVSASEMAHALKTCRCVHCDVAIAPMV